MPIINKQGPEYQAPLCFYRLDFPGDIPERPQPTADESKLLQEERFLLCRTCTAPITRNKERITKNNSHTHIFFNPSGMVFELCCFAKASGCLTQGDPTTLFTWFPGYSWQYALCSSCLTHLGWYYTSEDHTFYGLIKARLLE